jgi:hypothetical protein
MIADKKPWDGSYMQSSRLKNARRHLQPAKVKRSSGLRAFGDNTCLVYMDDKISIRHNRNAPPDT